MSRFLLLIILLASCMNNNPQEEFVIHGHRGCRGLWPENTLRSFEAAVDLGAQAIELDLVVTRDMELLVSHDPFMHHQICAKPDGSAIEAREERDYNIFNMSTAEAQTYVCGTLAHPHFPEQKQF